MAGTVNFALIRSTIVFTLAVAALGTGCSPRYWVLSKALKASGPPSALTGVKSYGLVSDWSGVTISGAGSGEAQGGLPASQPEAAWLAEADPETRRDWESDKNAMDEEFMAGIKSELPGYEVTRSGSEGSAILLVTTRYVQVVRGWNGCRVLAHVQFARGGVVVDELELDVAGGTALFWLFDSPGYTIGGRLRRIAGELGRRTAAFVSSAKAQ